MANLLAVWLRFKKQLLLNYLKRLQSLISRFVEANVEIGNIHMIQSLSDLTLTQLGLKIIGDRVRLRTKVMEPTSRGPPNCHQQYTFGSTINYDELKIYCSIVKLIVKSCMEYMRISVSFTMFFKSFIFRNFERQRYKNCCTGERIGPWASCFYFYNRFRFFNNKKSFTDVFLGLFSILNDSCFKIGVPECDLHAIYSECLFIFLL